MAAQVIPVLSNALSHDMSRCGVDWGEFRSSVDGEREGRLPVEVCRSCLVRTVRHATHTRGVPLPLNTGVAGWPLVLQGGH
eukprot:342692-Chlamydomonas_euryale.AAC.1